MKKLLSYGLGIVAALATTGCSDYLDRNPGDALSPATFWKTEADADLALTGCYREIQSPYRSEEMWYWDCTTDNQYNYHTHEGYRCIGNGSMASSGVSIIDYFTFLDIRTFNEYLQKENTIEFSSEAKREQYRAEVRVLRAMQYFWKINCYGDFPFTETVFETIEESKVPRTSKTTIMDFIISELKEIANSDVLPKTAASGRLTKGAAQAFLTRVYLINGNYAEAAAEAKLIMDSGLYSMPNLSYEESFWKANQYNSEVIFSTETSKEGGYSMWFGAYMSNGYGGWSSIVPTEALVESYEMKNGLTIDEDPTYDPKNPFVNRDPRLRATILYPGQCYGIYEKEGFKSIEAGNEDFAKYADNSTKTGYNFKKFYSNLDEFDDYWDADRNFPVFRYAEVLLSYAEACIEQNKIDDSVYSAINQVRKRAGMPDVDKTKYASQAKLRELVRRERRVEFAYEGLRRMDIIRWGIAKDVMTQPIEYMTGEVLTTKNADGDYNVNITGRVLEENRTFTVGKNELLPVPQSAIDANDQLTQNPGY
jgi:hypothetical protein